MASRVAFSVRSRAEASASTPVVVYTLAICSIVLVFDKS